MKTVRQLLRLKHTKGDLGIEVEVEGVNLPKEISPQWRVVEDGSLRGESAEYVLAEPLTADGAERALDSLSAHLSGDGVEVFDTVRAGVHVHVNVQDMTETQLFNYLCLTLILESPLSHYCGESRENNLFCLRGVDAEYLVDAIVGVATSERVGLAHFKDDNLRYAFMNVKAIPQYGSLEFRGMRGTHDKAVLKPWYETLLHMRQASIEYGTPVEIIQDFSLLGPIGFASKALGPHSQLYQLDEGELLGGVRLAQEIAFCKEWVGGKVVQIGGLTFPNNGEWFDEPQEDY